MDRKKTAGWIESGVFYLYALVAAPALIPMLRKALDAHGAVPWAGYAILGILLVETVGIWWLASHWRVAGGSPAPSGMSMKLGAGLVISHVLLAYFILMGALDMMGMMGGEGNEPSAWAPVLFVVMFFREAVFWVGAAFKRNVKKAPSAVKVNLGRAFVLLSQCVAFTVYWDVILQFEGLPNMALWGWIFLGPAVVLIFLIVYLPMRTAELLEPCFQTKNPGPPKGIGRRIILHAAVLALYPFVWEYIKIWMQEG